MSGGGQNELGNLGHHAVQGGDGQLSREGDPQATLRNQQGTRRQQSYAIGSAGAFRLKEARQPADVLVHDTNARDYALNGVIRRASSSHAFLSTS